MNDHERVLDRPQHLKFTNYDLATLNTEKSSLGLFHESRIITLVLAITYDGPSVKEKIFKYFFSPPYVGGRKYI